LPRPRGGCAAAALLAVLAPAAQAASTPPRAPDAAVYTLRLAFDARTHTLAGSERVTFRNPRRTSLRVVWLRTWPNGLASCRRPLSRVTLLAGGALVARRQRCTALQVRLAHPLGPGRRGSISLRFAVVAPKLNDRFGRSGSATMLGGAVPVLAVLDGASWSLPPYSNTGEAAYTLSAAWHASLDVPRGLRAATTGFEIRPARRLAGGARRLTILAPHARDFALAIGRFAVTTATAGGVRIRYFRQLPARPQATAVLGDAVDALRTYGGWFGPLRTPELDVVEGAFTVFGGQEYPQLVMTVPQHWAVAHELAHQWWYGLVGDDQWHAPWLDESFATFAERRLDNDFGTCRPSAPFADTASSVPLTATMASFERDAPAYEGVVYEGGSCALEALRLGLGDARLDDLLRGLVAHQRDGIVTTDGVIAAIRAAAPPGFDVAAWLSHARLPAPR
jgi:hypothetical protein